MSEMGCCQGAYPTGRKCPDCPHRVEPPLGQPTLDPSYINAQMKAKGLTRDDPITADKERAEKEALDTAIYEGFGSIFGSFFNAPEWSQLREHMMQPGFFATGGVVGPDVTFPVLGGGRHNEHVLPDIHDENTIVVNYTPRIDCYVAEIKPMSPDEEAEAIRQLRDTMTRHIVESFRIDYPLTTDRWRK